jgi:hypothetical protein
VSGLGPDQTRQQFVLSRGARVCRKISGAVAFCLVVRGAPVAHASRLRRQRRVSDIQRRKIGRPVSSPKEASLVILQIINTGKGMTEEEIKRVESILNDRPDQKAGRKNSHESLGIHNVNERIKLIYGKEYGLTIRPISDGETASTITIPYEYLQEDETAEPQRNTALNKLG